MDGAKGNALEWALALLRAPGERHALRQRPLPDGVDRLLGIAAGAMPDALAEARTTFGESEARIHEAAQFYAREILFFPQADAYRVLGVRRDAGAEQLKLHHRLLQHWLHPDRLRNQDDAVFAARVNSAWNHLRSPERRHAYDEACSQQQAPEGFDGGPSLRGVHTWVPDAVPAVDRWQQRLPVLALTAGCVLLALLVLRDKDRLPDRWIGHKGGEATASELDDAWTISLPAAEDARQPLQSKRENPARPSPADSPTQDGSRRAVLPSAIGVAMAGRASTPSTPPQQDRSAVAEPVEPKAGVQATYESPLPPDTAAVPKVAATESLSTGPANLDRRTAPDVPSFVRTQSAQQAGNQFVRYMGAIHRPPPPIWNSPGIESSAHGVRRDLHDRGPARLSDAKWRIGNEAAVLTVDYAVQGLEAENGKLTADLVWREGRWLVTGVSMERTR